MPKTIDPHTNSDLFGLARWVLRINEPSTTLVSQGNRARATMVENLKTTYQVGNLPTKALRCE